ncbi:cyclopropane-fatty-acyl-phospholipid synthase [Roseateles sp. YR242]|uniref:SAM-dependent methyltransferase n=1 Tax=Roseateles sp. YR242 TaxID=1855305 RepID=UPI0008B10798|nr:cyclopropane-fatty-acyl-phospholipid synthase family protein [Roseateles sp. YR242]SEL43258.1 cyclopropane-fatty-acyl-phospholipid synthase [Roseateles sp. YR242]
MEQELLSPAPGDSAQDDRRGAAVALPGPAPLPPAGLTLLQRLFDGYPGSLGLRVGSWATRLGRVAHQPPAFTLVLNDPSALRRLLLGQDPLRFAEAYFTGALDVEGDFFEALQLKDHLPALKLSWHDRLRLAVRLLAPPPGSSDEQLRAFGVRRHTRAENKAAIAFHYDLSNDFYALWLDPRMVYSCAYYETEETDLAQAQWSKLDHICRKLRLQPGEALLDVGCGWGALVMHAARHYGVKATGITLSERQLALAKARIQAAGMEGQVEVRLCDYRDMTGQFDKVSSVGMFEHVGLKNLPVYFASVNRLLKPGGLFLNHGITHEEEGWGQALSSRFINRYVFPDGELDRASNVMRVMEQQQFELHDVEGLRMHYAKTLRAWVARLEAEHDRALRYVDEAHYRIWRLYMAASALEFESGELGLYQILASKRDGGPAPVPLTRRYIYCV